MYFVGLLPLLQNSHTKNTKNKISKVVYATLIMAYNNSTVQFSLLAFQIYIWIWTKRRFKDVVVISLFYTNKYLVRKQKVMQHKFLRRVKGLVERTHYSIKDISYTFNAFCMQLGRIRMSFLFSLLTNSALFPFINCKQWLQNLHRYWKEYRRRVSAISGDCNLMCFVQTLVYFVLSAVAKGSCLAPIATQTNLKGLTK